MSTMPRIYNSVASLIGRVYYLPRQFAPPALRADIEAMQPTYYQHAEDILASALTKCGLSKDAARDSAFQFVAGILQGLKRQDEPVTSE